MNLLPGLASASVHPMLVHFPIALWLAATVMLLWSLRGDERSWEMGVRLVHFGSLGAVIAAAAGFIAADNLGHDSPGHAMVHDHRNVMVAVMVLGLAASGVAFRWRKDSPRSVRNGLMALMCFTSLLMVFGADRGANLVYRYGVGVLNEVPPAEDGHDHSHGSGSTTGTVDGLDHAEHGDDHEAPSDSVAASSGPAPGPTRAEPNTIEPSPAPLPHGEPGHSH